MSNCLNKIRLKQSCCGCCSLQAGTLIIGVSGWIMSLLQAIQIESLEKDVTSHSLAICLTVVGLGFSTALVIGAYRENRKFILPWLVIKGLELIVLYIATIVIFFLMFFITDVETEVVIKVDGEFERNEIENAKPGLFIFVFFIFLLFSFVATYMFLVVLSFYQDLGDNMASPQPMTAQEIQMVEQGGYNNQQPIGFKQFPQDYPPPYPPQQEMV